MYLLKLDCIFLFVYLWMVYMEWLWFYENVIVFIIVKKVILNMFFLFVRIGRGKLNLE